MHYIEVNSMRRVTSPSSIEKTVGELIDRLTGEIETSIDSRARALISAWSSNGVHTKTSRLTVSAPAAARPYVATEARPLIPLPRAERDFRVSYLRALLAQAPNRREAAKRAGVPYRTLCDMVRKLRIEA